MKMDYRPDGIIITLSQSMFRERGYKNWLKNFLYAMAQDEWTYWFRTGSQPKVEVPFLYICCGGKIRFRCNLVMTEGAGTKTFRPDNAHGDPIVLTGRAWLVCCGPVVRPPKGEIFERKGFQGFRYTPQLF